MKCKNCKKKIEYANFSADVESFGEVDFEREDYNIGDYGDWKNIGYSCPLCHKEITETEFENR